MLIVFIFKYIDVSFYRKAILIKLQDIFSAGTDISHVQNSVGPGGTFSPKNMSVMLTFEILSDILQALQWMAVRFELEVLNGAG